MPVKIAMIGAGSVGFTRRLMYDILSVPELPDTHFALMDISNRNLDMIYQLSERDVRASKLPAKVEATTLKRWRVTKLRPAPMRMPLTKAR